MHVNRKEVEEGCPSSLTPKQGDVQNTEYKYSAAEVNQLIKQTVWDLDTKAFYNVERKSKATIHTCVCLAKAGIDRCLSWRWSYSGCLDHRGAGEGG